ncbi:HRDC domain-containing protein [Bowdeniella massiliensis]|uniref:HRDC domain-containing protein n=1 Tax=Bowdeniella massiliensis TaxID=2932264 RepID=UPI00202896A7|nr:HRDC domain-containing protein [Bowdeniella massiliensis]
MTESELPLLSSPADGVPDVMTEEADLRDYIRRLKRGRGPLAVDTERASGFRYTSDAYLVQVRREGAGTALIDPEFLPDLSALSDAMTDVTWVLHAASQDLPCLARVGMRPQEIFDTELAARLLGDPKVSLGAVVERELGIRLAKEFSAVDWSERPLPHEWLVYAALDVELLDQVMAKQQARLQAAGKLSWAREEFEFVRQADPPSTKPHQWRRISRLSDLKGGRQLAMARELWKERDAIGRETNTCPSRLLPDRNIIALVKANPRTSRQVKKLPGLRNRRLADHWLAAIERARLLDDSQLPSKRGPGKAGLPDHRRWSQSNPEAAERLAAIRDVVAKVGEEHNVPAENMLLPAHQRLLAWVEFPASPAAVRAALDEMGTRSWQIGLLAEPIAQALRAL